MILSVIIPTRNRVNILNKAIESLVYQTLSQDDFEVIIVDNGSTDDTKEIVDSYANKIANLVYIYDDNPGLHVGRHRGLLESRTDILVYADDDIEAFPSWLEAIKDTFEKDKEVVLVGGKNLPNFETEPPKWIEDRWKENEQIKNLGALSIIDLGEHYHQTDSANIYGCNFSIKKDVLLKAGGFHPDGMPQELIRYRGDGESYVSEYIKVNSLKTIYNPLASVYHLVSKDRMTQEYFKKRYYNQGISDSYAYIRENINSRDELKDNLIDKTKRFIKQIFLSNQDYTKKAYLEGYNYHQNECKRLQELFDWVKRKSYIYDGNIK